MKKIKCGVTLLRHQLNTRMLKESIFESLDNDRCFKCLNESQLS